MPRPFAAALAFVFLGFAAQAGDAPTSGPLAESAAWEALKPIIFGDAEILDGSGLFTLNAPYRAHDAAVVPVDLDALPGVEAEVVALTLIVDENPSPVAAEFEFGPAMEGLHLSTRVRVNAYSNIRAVARTADGRLHMVGRFVKASGGCSAPALKDADAALADLGRMKLLSFDRPAAMSGRTREAQVMLRHPNYSGLQMDQTTQLYIPAHFVDQVEVRTDAELVFRMTGGISLSEDPTFRFAFRDAGGRLHVRATDTEGETFARTIPIDVAG